LAEHQFKGRREDQRLVTGQGRYTNDHHLHGQAAAHFLRADRAHARIVSIDTAEARKSKGVLDVVTGEDIVAAGWKTPPVLSFFKGVGGSSVRVPFRPGLAHGQVRFVGEPVVVVVAETEHLAQDAAEKIVIEYEDLPVVVDAAAALEAGAPRVHDDMPDNLCFEYEYGSKDPVEQAFAKAAHIIRVEVTAQRIAGNPMEPKSCMAHYHAALDAFDLYCPTQGISDIKAALAAITGLDAAKFRIHSNDVGGGFGVRNEIYPEFLALLLAAKRTGKPVRWTGTRSETITGDHHARGADLKGELAIDDKGKFLGLRVEWLVNMGAYCSSAGALINTVAAPTSSATSLYKVPAFYGRHRLAFTHTTPITAYRGAGRPNVAYLWERLVEQAAETLGVDPVRLRRRNILPKTAFPMKTLTGHTYDSGDPARLLDTALEAADWNGFKARRKAAKKSGKLRGIGLALFLEPSGAVGKEQIEIKIESDGKLALYSNAGPMGQGLETVFPEVVAKVLGVPEQSIEMKVNDIATPKLMGTGSFGSRSLISHGAALMNGAKLIVEKGKALAASELEVAASDVTFDNGVYKVAGTDLSVPLRTLLEKNWGQPEHPLDTNLTLDTAAAFPSGAHIAEVEIDPDTGALAIVNYIAADDCGNIINHAIVEGQIQGGLMQGVGQVVGEQIVYDPDTGQMLSGTFMDYFMPRADHAAPLTLLDCGVPSPSNPLGAKGAGEAGATGSVPALANAVMDALKAANVKHLEMPYTPYRVWQAIQGA
jgi:carbon-monoxide dehydrogenase large subunit